MKLGSIKPTAEGAYLTEVLDIKAQTAYIDGTANWSIENGAVRNVQYKSNGTSTGSDTSSNQTENGSYAGDGGPGEDALIYFIRAWNADDNTGYVEFYENVNNDKMFQGNVGTEPDGDNQYEGQSQEPGQPNLYFDAAHNVGESGNYVMLTNQTYILDLGAYPHDEDITSNLNGMKVRYHNNGHTSLTNLTHNNYYYLRKRNNNTFYLYSSQAAAKSDSEPDGTSPVIQLTDGTAEQTHYFRMFDYDFRAFQVALGADDISGDSSPIAKFEWVFPHPVLLRNGFGIRTSPGVNCSVGYRNLKSSTPLAGGRNAESSTTHNSDKQTGLISVEESGDSSKKGQGDIVLRGALNYGNDYLVVSEGKTEVWGIHGINVSTTTTRTCKILDSVSSNSSQSNSNTKARFSLSPTVNSGAERGAAMLGPINFDPPILCETGLVVHAPQNCNVMVIYRKIE